MVIVSVGPPARWYGDRQQAVDQDRRLALTDETRACFVWRLVDESQRFADCSAQDLGGSRYESFSPPVMTSFLPSCPGWVSVPTATAAISPVSTNENHVAPAVILPVWACGTAKENVAPGLPPFVAAHNRP